MSLFSFNDLATSDKYVANEASAVDFSASKRFISNERLLVLNNTIKVLTPGICCSYVTDGAWSNIELLEYIIGLTGPAKVYITTFAISAEALTRIAAWQETGQITDLYAVLDDGLNKRKPQEYQLATGVFKNLRVCKCHAKVMIICNDNYFISVCGSANFTKNQRKESGTIIFDQSVAENYITWIMEEFKNG